MLVQQQQQQRRPPWSSCLASASCVDAPNGPVSRPIPPNPAVAQLYRPKPGTCELCRSYAHKVNCGVELSSSPLLSCLATALPAARRCSAQATIHTTPHLHHRRPPFTSCTFLAAPTAQLVTRHSSLLLTAAQRTSSSRRPHRAFLSYYYGDRTPASDSALLLRASPTYRRCVCN